MYVKCNRNLIKFKKYTAYTKKSTQRMHVSQKRLLISKGNNVALQIWEEETPKAWWKPHCLPVSLSAVLHIPSAHQLLCGADWESFVATSRLLQAGARTGPSTLVNQQYLLKLNTCVPYDLATAFLRIYATEATACEQERPYLL